MDKLGKVLERTKWNHSGVRYVTTKAVLRKVSGLAENNCDVVGVVSQPLADMTGVSQSRSFSVRVSHTDMGFPRLFGCPTPACMLDMRNPAAVGMVPWLDFKARPDFNLLCHTSVFFLRKLIGLELIDGESWAWGMDIHVCVGTHNYDTDTNIFMFYAKTRSSIKYTALIIKKKLFQVNDFNARVCDRVRTRLVGALDSTTVDFSTRVFRGDVGLAFALATDLTVFFGALARGSVTGFSDRVVERVTGRVEGAVSSVFLGFTGGEDAVARVTRAGESVATGFLGFAGGEGVVERFSLFSCFSLGAGVFVGCSALF